MDSDLDRSTTVGTGRTTANATGTRHGGVGHTAPVHNSHMANVLDPRVPTGSGAGVNQSAVGNGRTGATTGATGTNYGPHSSKLMNKASQLSQDQPKGCLLT